MCFSHNDKIAVSVNTKLMIPQEETMKKENVSSIMKGDSGRGGSLEYSPYFIAEANIKGLDSPFDFHSHHQYEIFKLNKGQAHYLINNQVFELSPGQIVLLDGSELHKVQIMNDASEYERSIVHFDPDWIKAILEASEATFLLDYFKKYKHRIFRFQFEEDENELNQYIRRLSDVSKTKRTKGKESEIKIRLVHLLMHVYVSNKVSTMHEDFGKSEKAKLAEEIASYIQNRFNEKWTIADMSNDLNLSESYISHLFKEITGYTVMEYLMNYRLIQARTLLMMNPHQTIKDCAMESGFESDAHFNRFFKKNMGMTPKKYKEWLIDERKEQT